jgi:hypothetical protein
LHYLGGFFNCDWPEFERGMFGLAWSAFFLFFFVLGDGLACFMAYCNKEVVECVGYLLWVCDCLVFVFNQCWGCSALALGWDDGFEDFGLFFGIFLRLSEFVGQILFFGFGDGFSQSVSVVLVFVYVLWRRVHYFEFVQLVLPFDLLSVFGGAPWFPPGACLFLVLLDGGVDRLLEGFKFFWCCWVGVGCLGVRDCCFDV